VGLGVATIVSFGFILLLEDFLSVLLHTHCAQVLAEILTHSACGQVSVLICCCCGCELVHGHGAAQPILTPSEPDFPILAKCKLFFLSTE
jgi:hypothetical protein